MNLRYLFLAFVAIIISTSGLNAQQYAHAGEYMDAISAEYSTFQEDLWTYIKTAAHSRSARKIEKKRGELLKTTLTIQRKIKRMAPYEGDGSLKDSVANYFTMIYNVLNEDYGKIVDLEAIAEDSYDLMEAYLTAQEMANQRMEEASTRLSDNQRLFAEGHNITLLEGEESETSKKLVEASKVSNYRNDLFLIFFKSYKQEAYMMEAISGGDLNALVQNRKTLKKFSAEGLEQLKEIQAFNGDGSLVVACRTALEFFQEEAFKSQASVDFFLSQENIQKVKKAFEAKPQKERTKTDVDLYNQAVNDYNATVNNYNVTNKDLDKRRAQIIENWNKESDKFSNRHTP